MSNFIIISETSQKSLHRSKHRCDQDSDSCSIACSGYYTSLNNTHKVKNDIRKLYTIEKHEQIKLFVAAHLR